VVHYLICTTQRAGSNLLCSLLHQTGVAGMVPHPALDQELALQAILGPNGWGVPACPVQGAGQLRAFLLECFEQSRSPNGVGGWKLMMTHVEQLARRLDGSGDPAHVVELVSEDCRFVFLYRADLLGQAISIVRAMNTQCWDSGSQAEFRGLEIFDPHEALARCERLQAANQQWRRLLADTGDRYLELTYEQLTEDPAATVGRVCDHIGVTAPTEIPITSRYARQATARSDRYRRVVERLAASSAKRRRLDHSVRLPVRLLGRRLSSARFHRRVAREWTT